LHETRLRFDKPWPILYTEKVVIILLTVVHVLVCLFLIVVVLLQSGKAADLAGAFGGMGSQTAFGPRGSATLLSKATTISAIVFMLTSMSLSILATRGAGGNSSLDVTKKNSLTAPKVGVTPVAPAPKPQGGTPPAPAKK
jgi:preprotein translocase subunit SecG